MTQASSPKAATVTRAQLYEAQAVSLAQLYRRTEQKSKQKLGCEAVRNLQPSKTKKNDDKESEVMESVIADKGLWRKIPTWKV